MSLDEPDELCQLMAVVHQQGSGWLNLLPLIADDKPVPATPSVFAVFSKRGPVVPLATWTPAASGKRPTPVTIGIQHGVASGLTSRLADTPARVPAEWRVLSDHPRRGLVIEVPDGTSDRVVAQWLLACIDTVSMVPHVGRAEVFTYA